LPSRGEGFGLPIAEAQACGCPVITQDCSAMTELTVNGYCLKPLKPFWVTNLQYWWQMADPARIATALDGVHNWTDVKSREYCRKGAAYIKKNYSFPTVTKIWREFLTFIESEGSSYE